MYASITCIIKFSSGYRKYDYRKIHLEKEWKQIMTKGSSLLIQECDILWIILYLRSFSQPKNLCQVKILAM